MKQETIANNATEASVFISKIDAFPVKITVSDNVKKRSLTASAQFYVWLPIIAEHYGGSVEFIRKWMKHEIGFNILIRDGCDYSKQVLYMLEKSGYYRLDINQQMNMLNLFGVTSVMNSKQHKQLRDDVQIFWAKNGLQLEYLKKDEENA